MMRTSSLLFLTSTHFDFGLNLLKLFEQALNVFDVLFTRLNLHSFAFLDQLGCIHLQPGVQQLSLILPEPL